MVMLRSRLVYLSKFQLKTNIRFFLIKRATTPQVQSQFCPNESHCRLGTRSRVTGNGLQDGTEGDPVDREGARSTKSKHSTSSNRGLRVSPGRFVGL